MALSPNRCVHLKILFSETHPQIKFQDWYVKQNILIACTVLALAPVSCLKWPIFKKIREDRTVFFLFFRFRTVQGRNGEWRGFFSYLRRNLMLTEFQSL